MDSRHLLLRFVLRPARPAALILGVLAFLLLGGLPPGEVAAQPVLTFEASCTPDPIRANEATLLTCTTRISNTGDQPATNLVANIGPSSCSIPNFAFVDVTINGQLVPTPAFTLSFDIGNVDPGTTLEAALRVVVESFGPGRSGGAVDIVSYDDPTVHAGGDVCWDVSPDAAAPPTNLRVTKTLLTPVPEPPIIEGPEGGFGPPPPRPPDGGPVPVPFPPSPPNPETVDFEILVSNVSGVQMNDISLLDVQTGYGAMLVRADPPAASVDAAAGRATWSVPSLAPGAELRIVATYGPQPDAPCASAADIVVVNATPAAGTPEDYAAFGAGGLFGGGVPVGPCDFFEGLCYHYPPEGEPVVAPCDQEVCWSASPADGEFYQAYEGCDQEYCWFSPPGGGEPYLSLCRESVCWFDPGLGESPPGEGGGGAAQLYPTSCDVEFCEFTAPDGSASARDYCDFPICWTAPPEGGEYYPVYGCEQFLLPTCWFSPPGGGGEPLLNPCDFPIRFAVNLPEGAVDFGFGPQPVFEEPACWPVPPPEIDRTFFTYALPCDLVEFVLWLTPPNDGPAFPTFSFEGETEFCWGPVPPEELPPDVELPPDLLIPLPCEPGQEGKTGVPGSSVPAEVVDGESTPAALEQGTRTPIGLLASASVEPAMLVRPPYVEPAPPGTPLTPQEPTRPVRPQPVFPDLSQFSRAARLAQVLGIDQATQPSSQQPAQPAVAGLPSAGEGPRAQSQRLPLALAFGLALAGVAFVAVGALSAKKR